MNDLRQIAGQLILKAMMDRGMLNPALMAGKDPRTVANAILLGIQGLPRSTAQTIEQGGSNQPYSDSISDSYEGEPNQPYMNALSGAESISAREPIVDMSGPAAQDPNRIMGVSPQEIWARFSGSYPGAAQQVSDAAKLMNILSYVGLMPRGGMGGRMPMPQSPWPQQGRLPITGPVSKLPQQTRTSLADIAGAGGTRTQQALAELARRQANYERTVPVKNLTKTERDIQRLGDEVRGSKGSTAKYHNAPRHGRLQGELEESKTSQTSKLAKKDIPPVMKGQMDRYGTGKKGPKGGGFPEEQGRSGKAPKGSLMRELTDAGETKRGGRPIQTKTKQDFADTRRKAEYEVGVKGPIQDARLKKFEGNMDQYQWNRLLSELRQNRNTIASHRAKSAAGMVRGVHIDDTGKIIIAPGKKGRVAETKRHEYGHRIQLGLQRLIDQGKISKENKALAEKLVAQDPEGFANFLMHEGTRPKSVRTLTKRQGRSLERSGR